MSVKRCTKHDTPPLIPNRFVAEHRTRNQKQTGSLTPIRDAGHAIPARMWAVRDGVSGQFREFALVLNALSTSQPRRFTLINRIPGSRPSRQVATFP
jgi:hypothetical protein